MADRMVACLEQTLVDLKAADWVDWTGFLTDESLVVMMVGDLAGHWESLSAAYLVVNLAAERAAS